MLQGDVEECTLSLEAARPRGYDSVDSTAASTVPASRAPLTGRMCSIGLVVMALAGALLWYHPSAQSGAAGLWAPTATASARPLTIPAPTPARRPPRAVPQSSMASLPAVPPLPASASGAEGPPAAGPAATGLALPFGIRSVAAVLFGVCVAVRVRALRAMFAEERVAFAMAAGAGESTDGDIKVCTPQDWRHAQTFA